MTPKRFIKDLGALVAANRGNEALEFWRRYFSGMAPSLTSEQIVWVADLMHMADLASDLDEVTSAKQPVEPEPQSTRRT